MLAIACYWIYQVLLSDNTAHCSIAAIIKEARYHGLTQHLLIIWSLPIYLAFVIFGVTTASIYLGAFVQRTLLHFFRKYFLNTVLRKNRLSL